MPEVFWELTLREFDLLVQHFNNTVARENVKIWTSQLILIDHLASMFNKEHTPRSYDDWFNPTYDEPIDEMAKKRELLEVMGLAVEKFGIPAPQIEVLREEIEAYDRANREAEPR